MKLSIILAATALAILAILTALALIPPPAPQPVLIPATLTTHPHYTRPPTTPTPPCVFGTMLGGDC